MNAHLRVCFWEARPETVAEVQCEYLTKDNLLDCNAVPSGSRHLECHSSWNPAPDSPQKALPKTRLNYTASPLADDVFLCEVKARGSGLPSVQPRQLPSGYPHASRVLSSYGEILRGASPSPGSVSLPSLRCCWPTFQACPYFISSWAGSAPSLTTTPPHGHLHFGPYPAVVTPSASGFVSHTLRAPGGQSLCLTVSDTVSEPRTVHGPWQSPADVGRADLATLFETRCSELNCVSSQVHTLNP